MSEPMLTAEWPERYYMNLDGDPFAAGFLQIGTKPSEGAVEYVRADQIEALMQAEHRAVMASVRLGKWMSAALDDPAVCEDMKADIREWFSSGPPPHAMAASPTPTNDGEGLVARLREAAKPWADYHGDIPDYDHPLRPVFESGVQYAVELLAKMLHVEDWEICDGTEEFDGDLGGTLLNIVIKTWPTDQNGDWLDLRDPETLAALNQGAGQ